MVSTRTPPSPSSPSVLPEAKGNDAARFTPGPWHIWGLDSKRGELTVGIASERGAEKHIAYLAWNKDSARNPGEATGLDDARLIAAAPDLYEALSEIKHIAEHDDNSRFALSKIFHIADVMTRKARSGEPGKMEGGGS